MTRSAVSCDRQACPFRQRCFGRGLFEVVGGRKMCGRGVWRGGRKEQALPREGSARLAASQQQQQSTAQNKHTGCPKQESLVGEELESQEEDLLAASALDQVTNQQPD
jgi:hypothetical protein